MSVKEIVVNDVYIPLLSDTNRYLVLLGGAGSGKSVFAAQKILIRITTEKKHRILACRKFAVTLRESVFKLIKEQISDWGLSHEFTVNKTDKTFYHIPTGNEIICVGLDDPEKLKSIVGITAIWMEETSEDDEEDLDQLDLRMRGATENYKQILLTFNPIDERHWLKKRFADNKPENATVIKTTYVDNHFIDEEYRSVLEAKAAISPNFYRIYKLGDWGKAEVKNPWAHNFNYDKHVSDRAVFDPAKRVYFSHDFNVAPMAVVACHIWKDDHGPHIHFFQEISLNPGDSYKMAEKIASMFPPEVLYNAYFTGDASARSRNTVSRDNIHNWTVLQEKLKISDTRLQVPRANPRINDSKTLVNLVLALHPDIKFHPSMSTTINELQFTEADEDGGIMKANRENPDQRADFLDTVRYSLSTWLSDYYKLIRK